MIKLIPKTYIVLGVAFSTLTACSHADVASVAADSQKTSGFQYMAMDNYSYDMAKFVGLVEGESFAESEGKINAVFKAYDGHADPLDIRMDSKIVDAGWKQVLVTQDGLMDGTVTGQQLLAIYDDDLKLVTYGMRIKCHSASGVSGWQASACG